MEKFWPLERSQKKQINPYWIIEDIANNFDRLIYYYLFIISIKVWQIGVVDLSVKS